MRLLIAGGTSFLGRATALAAVATGHTVAVINRGVTPSDLPEVVEHLIGDRHGDLSALDGRSFDATVDTIAYRPSDVASLHAALGDRGGHHVQISSVSAYTDPPEEGATEATAELWAAGSVDPDAPITATSYGPLKAECERAAASLFGAGVAVVRPTFVIGGHDATLRFPYWVQRARRGGTIAVPGPRDNALQYIDARDLGAFVVALAVGGATGAFTAAGPFPSARFVDAVEQIVRRVAPAGTEVEEVAPEDVERASLGERFPLWTGGSSETALAMDPAKALAAGLSLRPLADSVDDVVTWWGDRPWPDHWLDPASEARLLAAASDARGARE
ncbi:MAG TPA: NAD-dependent epimerase/dehydratase family protein [Acidimicrobiales bacterium]|jgi:2'-hydroxyisoflavone reductase|nr:NAD-dependent epimerase/dehydratase family protein [Acidimicrobiales bacterium]